MHVLRAGMVPRSVQSLHVPRSVQSSARTSEQTIELYIAIAVAIAFARTNVPLSSARLPTSFIHPLRTPIKTVY